MSARQPIHILLMEDNTGHARLARRALERDGYAVDLAPNGDSGLAMYAVARHDLLIVDHRMPGRDGLEVLRALAAKGPLPPVIMVTGHGDESLAVEALHLGVSDYVIKDVEGRYLTLLPVLIERALRQWHLAEQKRQAEEALQHAYEQLDLQVQERTAALARANALLQAESAAHQTAREELAQEHAFVSAILQTVGALVVVLDTHGRIVHFNHACERATGYAFAEVQGKLLWDLCISPDELARVRQTFDELRRGGRDYSHTNAWLTRDGGRRLISWSNTVLRDRQGMVAYIIGTGIDITEQHQAQAALAERDARTRAILDTAAEGIITIDDHGIIETFNAAAERLFGYSAVEAIGQNVAFLMPSPYSVEHDSYIARYLQTRERRIIGIGREVAGRRKDGSIFPMDLAISEVCLGTRRLFTGFVRDLSRRKRAEQEMQRADRLAMVGQLASGLAHEIGTPLNVIAGNAELLRLDLRQHGISLLGLDTIVEQADRITRLIERLLTFARTKEQPAELLSLETPLASALRLLETCFRREAITVLVEVPADLPPAHGAADQLEQVFLNVLVNAWHAMPEGGTITITASTTTDSQVQIAIRDTGAGMSAAQLKRAFEPFFSTKGDRGTGLGLAICKQIIEAHRGTIRLDSTCGVGTTVTLTLPGAPAAEAVERHQG